MAKLSVIEECAEKGIEVPGTRLIPIKFIKRDSNRGHIWLFKCNCGKEKEINIYSVSNIKGSRQTVSCGCNKKEKSRLRKGIKYSKEHNFRCRQAKRRFLPQLQSKKRWFYNIKQSAKYRKIEFKLIFEEAISIAEKPCFYTGIIDTYSALYKKTKKDCLTRGNYFDEEYWSKSIIKINGLDRIDSSKGYTIDNVVSCCNQANLAKSDYSQEEFILMCNKVAKLHPREV